MNMIRTDAQLVEAARQGDPVAMSNLLSICQPDLKRFARRTCSNAEDAENAVQMALWQLSLKVGTLRTVAAFATWLFRIVERECYRLFRGAKSTLALDDLTERDQPHARDVPTDLKMDLVRAMQGLSPPYLEVLILRDVHELTAPEVAQELGVSVEAVKSRLHRARGMVREHLLASGYWSKDAAPFS